MMSLLSNVVLMGTSLDLESRISEALLLALQTLSLGHSMSNQHKKILTLTDLNETWFLHGDC